MAGSVVYGDPLINPTVINCRYIPEEQLPAKERWFDIQDRHRTWATGWYRWGPGGSPPRPK